MVEKLSPAVNVLEQDNIFTVPAVSTSTGAIVGSFAWGPVDEPQLLDSENSLLALFGRPSGTFVGDWYCANNFLSYSRSLYVTRVVGAGAFNASLALDTGAFVAGTEEITNKNQEDHESHDYSTATEDMAFIAKYPGAAGNSLGVATFTAIDSGDWATWPYADNFDYEATGTEVHVVVIDVDGAISGEANKVLETFAHLKNEAGATLPDGTDVELARVIDSQSSYINVVTPENCLITSTAVKLGAGADGALVSTAERLLGYDIFASDSYDIGLIIQGMGDNDVGAAIVTLAENRKDCVALVGSERADTVGVVSLTTALTNEKASRLAIGSSTYGFFVSGWKYMFDKYNNKNIWVPMNPDAAGTIARADYNEEVWVSPAGIGKGSINNVIKISQYYAKTHRDELYKNDINCVIIDSNDHILFGDKTMAGAPSAFDRINIRRLFIVLGKSLGKALKRFLFKSNTSQTRNQARVMMEQFLNDVQGRQGVTAYQVICDESNNDENVRANKEMRATVKVAPVHATNYITLTLSAERDSGVNVTVS